LLTPVTSDHILPIRLQVNGPLHTTQPMSPCLSPLPMIATHFMILRYRFLALLLQQTKLEFVT